MISVQPITRGYFFTFTLQFTLPGGDPVFSTPVPSRIRGEFRKSPDPTKWPLLGAVDTQDGSLVLNADGSITMKIAEAVTALFPQGKVVLDFARVDNGVTSPVGVLFQWPVITPVTAAMT